LAQALSFVNLKTKAAQGLKWQAVLLLGKQFISLTVFTVLARVLETSAFGLFALVGVYLAFVGMFVDQGIGMALIQRRDLTPEHKDTAFWFNIGCAAALCVGTVALANPVAALFKEPRLVPLLRWSSLGLVIGALSGIHTTLFTRAMDFRQIVLRNLIANAAGGAAGVGMALAGCGVWSLIGQQLVGTTIGTVFLWSISTYRPSLRFSLPHLRELFGFSVPVLVSSYLWYLSTSLDQIIIGRFAGMHTLGLYSVAGKIPNLANMATQQPLANVSLPSLSRLQDDHNKMRQTVSQGMELNAVISFAIFVGLAVVAPDLVPLLFGVKWAAAVAPCSLLSLYALANALQVFVYPILLATGGIGKYVWLSILHTIGVLVACLVGIQFGVTYVVLGLIVNSVVIGAPGVLSLRQRIDMSPLSYCKPCLVPALASLFMAGVVWLMAHTLTADITPILRLTCKIVAGATAYLVFVMIFRPAILAKLLTMVRHAGGFSFKAPSAITASPFEN
jgi:O-antigen/teichoic acid export membrane protein